MLCVLKESPKSDISRGKIRLAWASTRPLAPWHTCLDELSCIIVFFFHSCTFACFQLCNFLPHHLEPVNGCFETFGLIIIFIGNSQVFGSGQVPDFSGCDCVYMNIQIQVCDICSCLIVVRHLALNRRMELQIAPWRKFRWTPNRLPDEVQGNNAHLGNPMQRKQQTPLL